MWIETPNIKGDLPNLSIHGSHNATLVLEHRGEILEIIEFERLLDSKNIGFCQYSVAASRRYIPNTLLNYIHDKYGFSSFGTVLHQHCESSDDTFTSKVELFKYYSLFPAQNYIEMHHHEAHAAGAFYQSSFDNALAISFDGGGNDGFFNIYECDRSKGLRLVGKKDVDLGFAYMVFGEFIEDIRRESTLSIGNLVYAGKILGYQSYGKVVEQWYSPMKNFYLQKPDGGNYIRLLEELGDAIGLKFDADNRFKNSIAHDLAATSQKVFEDIFFDIMDDYVVQYDMPIIISGGCAMNIVLNTKVRKYYNRGVFVGSNPSDCGIATGMMLHCLKPQKQYDVSYLGIPVVDPLMLSREVEKRNAQMVSIDCVVDDLYHNRIVGVVQGRSEHGPRALGNRSIICSPLRHDMKDVLNAKVKNREYYRPFAPIVRLEDVSEYFDWQGPSEFMSFCPTVKEEWRSKMPSITHVDGTARVQTVTREKNPFIYDVLTLFKERTGVGVLINTSFNVNGKPILSSYKDAFEVFDTTQLDRLYLNGFYFSK
jgi:carbamoyltransferase